MILVVGVSHKTAPIGVRERIAIPHDRIRSFLTRLVARPEISELLVVSTCNRVEVYACSALDDDPGGLRAADAVVQMLAEQAGAEVGAALQQYLFRYVGDAAVRHLFRVASSLDSLVVGEAQVLGQVKQAFDLANDASTLGPLLGRAIEWAFHVAKRVRSETEVGAGSVSVASVAVELARQIFGNLDDRVVALLGAGTMGQAAARHLCDAGANLIVLNRSAERAEALSERFDATTRGWDELEASLLQTDVVIASTGSSEYVLTRPMLASIQRRRRGRSLFVIDIAVPRNVDPRINEIDGVYLYDIDDLSRIAGETLRDRSREAQSSERIVSEEADAFDAWLDALQVTPTIVALRNQVRSVLEAELDRSLRGKLKHLSEQDRKALGDMLGAGVKKLTHQPTVRLKTAAAEGNARPLAHALQHLFDLDTTAPSSSKSSRPSRPSPSHNALSTAASSTASSTASTQTPEATETPQPYPTEGLDRKTTEDETARASRGPDPSDARPEEAP